MLASSGTPEFRTTLNRLPTPQKIKYNIDPLLKDFIGLTMLLTSVNQLST